MDLLLVSLTLLSVIHLTRSYPYPLYSDKRYVRSPYQPTYSYIPVPVSYQMPQMYEDNQDEMSIPGYGYYNYPMNDEGRYVDDSSENIQLEQGYPYGQEMWYEGDFENNAMRAAANAEARAAFLRNLIITQMYQDAAASAAIGASNPRYMYQSSYPQIPEENGNFEYGIATSGDEEQQRAREFLREDEEVKELESLRKAASKDGKRRRKQKAKEAAREKKQDPEIMLVTSKPFKTDGSSLSDRKNLFVGQKEVVLPQPPRPVRKPFSELTQRLNTRSEKPSPYHTIKQLLAMDTNSKKTEGSKIQKRFISTEEQLTSQLSSLKKSSF